MKATGVVRRMDDLGRIVIPKEIRRTLMIREGDSMEIYMGSEGEILLKKYSPIGQLSRFTETFAKVLATQTEKIALLVDMENVIVAAGKDSHGFAEARLSERMHGLLKERRFFVTQMGEKLFDIDLEKKVGAFASMVVPIVVQQEAMGALLLCAKEKEVFSDVDKALMQNGAKLLASQLET
ncbi:AbrB family transcriptional regulator, stage V sporulation protein T [Lachnospiraceae bacterium XBB1006]|nr:AbrB family transcriptional regulator, stage V sporulation protein T [Lachnospiraceae bacterium XBB1006]